VIPGMHLAVFANPFRPVLRLIAQQDAQDAFPVLEAPVQFVFALGALVGFFADQETGHACVTQASINQSLQCGFPFGFGFFPQGFIVQTCIGCRFELSGIADNVRIHDVGIM
jgi:hypothetical protein